MITDRLRFKVLLTNFQGEIIPALDQLLEYLKSQYDHVDGGYYSVLDDVAILVITGEFEVLDNTEPS